MSFLFVKFSIYLCCTFLVFSNLQNSVNFDTFAVEIENGKIIGENQEEFYAFKGIPYATAERFSLPKKINEKWKTPRVFKEFGDVCSQYDHFSYGFLGDENCLSLNVFVPKSVRDSPKLAPVIFFIHGGAFMFGGALYYGPENIMNHGKMILVTINYRLGILGFLSTEDEILPGNLGLKDQIEALKWVQRNIKAFNGDPSKVTIVGLSAGGASVHLHYMSKLSKGLFNNGISHSGVAINPWVMMERGKEKAHQVGALLGCDFGNDHKSLIKCLKTANLEQLVMTAKYFQPFLYNPFSPFGVSVEPDHVSAFLTQHPREILENKTFSKRPWIATQVENEGLYPGSEFYSEKILKNFNDNWLSVAPHLLDFNGTTTDLKMKETFSNLIRNFYYKNQAISLDNFDKLIELLSDRLFKADFHNALIYHASQAPTYCYYFKYQIKQSKSVINNSGKSLGVAHGDDVFLIFNNRNLSDYSHEEKKIGKYFLEMYKNYSTDNYVSFSLFDKNLECMEIQKSASNSMVEMKKSFGNSEFWSSLKINE